MPEKDSGKQTDFMMEKIKERPINKRKLFRKTVTTICMAVLFGLIACLTFLVLEPLFSKWMTPEETPPVVILPPADEEMNPEDMLVEEEEPASLQEALESVILEDEQLQKLLGDIRLDKANYIQLYTAMSSYVAEMEASMVTVTGVTSDVDWLNGTYESEGWSGGVIVASNGQEYLILTDRSTVYKASHILVSFCDGTKAEAELKQMDTQTGLAVVAVQIGILPDTTTGQVTVAALGTSNQRNIVGLPVVALGAPLGMTGSVGYGMVAADRTTMSVVDANYKLLTTDIYGSANSTGVLFNLSGQIIGIITPNRASSDLKNAVTAIGISELRKLIENMSNGVEGAYLGITGTDVTADANEQGVPYGAYVKEVAMDSPAMLAGIQSGDIIVEIGESSIESFANYTSSLQRLEAGETVRVVLQRLSQGEYRELSMDITLGVQK